MIDLEEFRRTLTGERIIELLKQHNGRLRVDLPIGVGKSFNIDKVIEFVIRIKCYKLVIAFFPTRAIINERQYIIEPPSDVQIVNLRPRPKEKCGKTANRLWGDFEKNNLGALGRRIICGTCRHYKDCYWLQQFGKNLRNASVIYGTQAHLERSPDFVDQIIKWSGASNVLVILDEANFIMKSFQRKILKQDLLRFLEVLQKSGNKKFLEINSRWSYLVDLLTKVSTEDLRCDEWKMPHINSDWALHVQQTGYDMYGKAFYFPANDLVQFCHSSMESRERNSEGAIQFAVKPYINTDFIIYSGTADHEFSQYRLGQDFASPFADLHFFHPETQWYNIASRLGARRYFIKNSKQILDFFAGLVARRLSEKKRPLLIAKKCFVKVCGEGIEKRLQSMGFKDVQVVADEWYPELLKKPQIIPLINYGMIGTNMFQEFDCAYCLTGYYTREDVVNGILQDIFASDIRVPIDIKMQGRPFRRTAGVKDVKDRIYNVHEMSQKALNNQEIEVVLQAVGRARPYTKPREIITFQCGAHPKYAYTREFNCLGEAREYFNILTGKELQKYKIITNIQELKAEGYTQEEIAKILKKGVRTIQRYWKKEPAIMPSIIY